MFNVFFLFYFILLKEIFFLILKIVQFYFLLTYHINHHYYHHNHQNNYPNFPFLIPLQIINISKLILHSNFKFVRNKLIFILNSFYQKFNQNFFLFNLCSFKCFLFYFVMILRKVHHEVTFDHSINNFKTFNFFDYSL